MLTTFELGDLQVERKLILTNVERKVSGYGVGQNGVQLRKGIY
jgi:hypothetical protein